MPRVMQTPMSSAQANPTWAVTSQREIRPIRIPEAPRDSSFKALFRSTRAACHAGTPPASRPASRVNSMAKPATR